MGIDYGSHPIDPAIFRDRLVPYVMGRGDITDLIERAVQVASVRNRADAWTSATFKLSNEMRAKQEAVAPSVTREIRKAGSQSFLGKIFGKPAPVKIETYETPAYAPGMPAFDPDLHVWGRPFFNTADTVPGAIAAHQSFIDAVGKPPAMVGDICRAMLDDLDKRRSQASSDLHPAVRAEIDRAPPYLGALKLDDTDLSSLAQEETQMRRTFVAHWHQIRALWDLRDTKAPIDLTALEQQARIASGLPAVEENPQWIDVSENAGEPDISTAANALAGLPYQITQFAAALHPGWIGKGYGYASSALQTINVDASHLFEKLTPLFDEMVVAEPASGRVLREASYDFSFGQYVPPAKVPLLVALLEKHQDALIRAWANGEPTAIDLQDGLVSHMKNLEPASYAAKNGWAYLETISV